MYEQPDLNDEQLDALITARGKEEQKLSHAQLEKDREKARREAKRAADEEEAAQRKVVALRASGFEIRRTRWLWRDRIPMGGLALIAGKGDVSKSTLLAQMCAWITTGDMKGEFYGTPRNVLYVVNEDSIEETVVPRMLAHDADMDRVYFIRVHHPMGTDALSLPNDAQILCDSIKEHDAVATFVDPLSANVTGRKNDQGDMRSTYQAVNNIGERSGTAIVGLAHTRKAGASDVLEAVIGSSEQTNVARSVHGLAMDKDEDGARLLSCEKLNVGQRHLLSTLRFAVKSQDIRCTNDEITYAPRIQWLDETDDTASDMMADQLYGHHGTDDIARVIRQYVMNNGGEVFAADALALNELKKVSQSMIQRARKKAGVQSKRERAAHARAIWFIPLS